MRTVDPSAFREYRESLETCRRQRSEAVIPNRWPWQCRLAVRTLSNEALQRQVEAKRSGGEQVTVRILTSTLPEYVYGGEVAQCLSEFVRMGGRLRVLVWNDIPPRRTSSPFLQTLRASKDDYRLSGFRPKAKQLRHLMTVGDDAYRLEAPHDIVSADFSDFSPEVAATICFNDTDAGGRIVSYFESIWNALDALDVEKSST